MAWRPMQLRGTRVLAKCDETGALDEVQGKVAICYRDGGKQYQALRKNLFPVDEPKARALPSNAAGPTDLDARKPSREGGPPRARSGVLHVHPGTVDVPPKDAAPGIVRAFTDGACSGNPGPAGIGVVLISEDGIRELSGYLGLATNNIAELRAIGVAAEAADPEKPLHIFTDSTYAIGVLSGRMKAKKNKALIDAIRAELMKHVECWFFHVSAHVGVDLNERADALAVQAAKTATSTGWQPG